MRLYLAALAALLMTPVLVTAQGSLGSYEDRIAVADVMARYVWAVDSFDADGYVTKITTTYMDGTSSFATYLYE